MVLWYEDIFGNDPATAKYVIRQACDFLGIPVASQSSQLIDSGLRVHRKQNITATLRLIENWVELAARYDL